MLLWQKLSSAAWVAANEPSLQEIASCNLAIISRPGRIRSLVQIICRRRAESQKLVREFGGVARALPRNWSTVAQSQKARAPIRIGRRLEIVSELAGSSDASGKLLIPVAGAFGTGEHATTAMSLRLLEEMTRNLPCDWGLLDVGTGTGILALAARRLGASKVLGLDNDPRAVAHARQNARLNHISCAKFVRADLLQWEPTGRYDLITANLFSELLIAALPMFRCALRPDGCLIASGILREQARAVKHALCRAGFQLGKQRRRGKWIALFARLEGSAPSFP